MKIVISSAELADGLNKIDFENDSVQSATTTSGNLILKCSAQEVSFYCSPEISEIPVNQENRRWEFIKDLVNKVEEQPIVLTIQRNVVSVIFQY